MPTLPRPHSVVENGATPSAAVVPPLRKRRRERDDSSVDRTSDFRRDAASTRRITSKSCIPGGSPSPSRDSQRPPSAAATTSAAANSSGAARWTLVEAGASKKHPPQGRDLGHQPAHAHRRARARRTSRGLLPAHAHRPTSRRAGQDGEDRRECDTGARINLSHSNEDKPRGRPKAPDVCTSLRRHSRHATT